MRLKDIGLCVAFALTLPVGQMLFKLAALKSKTISGGFVAKVVFNYALIGAFAWYGVSAFLWFYILTRVPLSAAYPFSIMGAALVPLLAMMFFREPITLQAGVGYVVMLAGFLLIVQAR